MKVTSTGIVNGVIEDKYGKEEHSSMKVVCLHIHYL